MTDYKKIADMMQAQPVDRKLLTEKAFKALCEHRKLNFVQNIDEVDGVQREVWGNRNFQIIVTRTKNNEFTVL